MKIILDQIDTGDYSINIEDCKCPEDLVIVTLIAQTIDFHYDFIQKHHGVMAGTITDLVEHIND